jgi:hypothetical protein
MSRAGMGFTKALLGIGMVTVHNRRFDKPLKSETGHSTQKPVECMLRPIENNSSKVGAVGTIVALARTRHWFGVIFTSISSGDRVC